MEQSGEDQLIVRIVLHPDECHGVLSRQIQFEIGGIQASEGLWIVWLEVFRANSYKVLQRLCFRYGALGIRITKREKVSVKPGKREVMTQEQRTTFVSEQFAKRKELQTKVDELATERAAHIKVAMTQVIETGKADSFDLRVAEIIQDQARRRGIQYDLNLQGP